MITTAQELFKITHSQHLARGYERSAINAACLYFACRQYKVDRTIKELCRVTSAQKKAVGRVILKIKKKLLNAQNSSNRGEMLMPTCSTFMLRFCRLLNLPAKTISAAIDACNRVVELGICDGQTPAVIAAASIFLICQMKDRRNAKQIAEVAMISEGTVRSTYRKIAPYRKEIIPKDFMSGALLRHLNE